MPFNVVILGRKHKVKQQRNRDNAVNVVMLGRKHSQLMQQRNRDNAFYCCNVRQKTQS